jgi:crotonobetainyl-CoA:carnitine CoA-transferase CaiB-like acyl-CoA transferase
MQDQTSTSPLEGVRVLDFSIMLAGPYCARLLADVGAEVIKIEPPEGDEMRLRAPVRDGHSAYFGQLNAGKRSIALDLKSPDAIKLVHRMVENTDILVENFRPGVMERLGLGYEALRKINPRLIYCSISGYGQTGPQAERAAYAMIVHAESGFDRALMRYAGDRDRPAAGRGVRRRYSRRHFRLLCHSDGDGAALAHRRRAAHRCRPDGLHAEPSGV